MMLPKMSGLEVLRELKKEPATEAIPVVVLTGLSKQIRSDCGVTEPLVF
jgi:CheY-like chemotaxis protein